MDHRADIFSLGVVLYEMLTGHVPQGVIAPPSRKVSVDVRVDEVVLRSLEREPERRFQRVAEVGEQVDRIRTSAGSAPGESELSRLERRIGAFFDAGLPLAYLALALTLGLRLIDLSDSPKAIHVAVPLFVFLLPSILGSFRGPREHPSALGAIRGAAGILGLGLFLPRLLTLWTLPAALDFPAQAAYRETEVNFHTFGSALCFAWFLAAAFARVRRGGFVLPSYQPKALRAATVVLCSAMVALTYGPWTEQGRTLGQWFLLLTFGAGGLDALRAHRDLSPEKLTKALAVGLTLVAFTGFLFLRLGSPEGSEHFAERARLTVLGLGLCGLIGAHVGARVPFWTRTAADA